MTTKLNLHMKAISWRYNSYIRILSIHVLKASADPGDIVIVVRIKDHPVFMREGDDLLITRFVNYFHSFQCFFSYLREISLNEALCGFEIPIRHLDGRSLVLTGGEDGKIITTGSFLM